MFHTLKWTLKSVIITDQAIIAPTQAARAVDSDSVSLAILFYFLGPRSGGWAFVCLFLVRKNKSRKWALPHICTFCTLSMHSVNCSF